MVLSQHLDFGNSCAPSLTATLRILQIDQQVELLNARRAQQARTPLGGKVQRHCGHLQWVASLNLTTWKDREQGLFDALGTSIMNKIKYKL